MADDEAPHGRDENGTPLAPYGLTVEGRPRKSRRGAAPGQRGNKARTAPAASAGPRTSTTASAKKAADRRQMLCELSSMLLETPLAAASQVPQIRTRIGARQADALAGDAFLLAQYMPQLADGFIFYGQHNPKALAWLEKLEESGPAVVIAAGLLQLGKALVQNHLNPNPQLAAAGRNMVEMRMLLIAEQVNAQAAAYRAQADPAPEPVREPENRGYDGTAYEREAEPTAEFARA